MLHYRQRKDNSIDRIYIIITRGTGTGTHGNGKNDEMRQMRAACCCNTLPLGFWRFHCWKCSQPRLLNYLQNDVRKHILVPNFRDTFKASSAAKIQVGLEPGVPGIDAHALKANSLH